MTRRGYYPEIAPRRTGRLKVSSVHELYWEECGNEAGKPAVFLRGASALFPDAWESYLAPIPEAERGDLLRAYYNRLTSDDARVRSDAAKAWSVWEGSTSSLFPNPALVEKCSGDAFATAFARIESHYFVHDAWLAGERALLANVGKIRKIPGVIAQGRYDVVCPMESAWPLPRAWPDAD